MKTLNINTANNYTIYIDHHLLQTSLVAEICSKLNKRLAIITDSNLVDNLGKNLQAHLHTENLSAELFSFPAGEANKTRASKQQLEDELLAKNFGRDSCIIALGGGVVSDLVGFLAATYCRGVPVIYIPTTLLAMVDASIGGKTAINTQFGKNLIGSFTQPQAVIIDTSTLASLSAAEYANGSAEVIKHGLIADADLLQTLANHSAKFIARDADFLTDIIYRSCLIKKNIVEQDEMETGLRQLLNFGHTVGHAIEIVDNYRIRHGEAVAMGMLVESYLSLLGGYLQEDILPALSTLLAAYGLRLTTSAFQNKTLFRQALNLDKKAINSQPRFVLLEKIAQVYQQDASYTWAVDDSLINQALDWAKEQFKPL